MCKIIRTLSLFAVMTILISACTAFGGTGTRPPRSSGDGANPISTDTGDQATREAPGGGQTAPTQALPHRTPLIAPSGTTVCDLAEFVEDVTIPDGTVVSAGETFTKSWRIRNIGTCLWDSEYYLYFYQGEDMGTDEDVYHIFGYSDVANGQEVVVSIDLTAPLTSGSYSGEWRIKTNLSGLGTTLPILDTDDGYSLDVNITVQAAFAVTDVRLGASHSGFCGKGGTYTVQADITTNAAGTVKYHWVRSDGETTDQQMIKFISADKQTVSYEWSPLVPHTGLWVDLYIESPNDEQFGRAYLNCP